MRLSRVVNILAAAVTAGLLMCGNVLAERNQIIDRVDVTEKGECAVIDVRFNLPMRYIRHFPYESGDDLRIQLEPIALNPADQEALFKREFLRAPPNEVATLTDVIYEGNIEGGPFLSLYFDSTVFFRVE